ncbi:AhpD-like protein [Pyronema domesticum]|nr:AhpD-like protein [Pyronema domesticum]
MAAPNISSAPSSSASPSATCAPAAPASDSHLASPSFLRFLSTQFPSTSKLANPYTYISGIVFASTNHAEAAGFVHNTTVPACESIKYREALYKTAVLYGAPRMINSLLACGPTTGEAKKTRRNPRESVEELERRGVELFNSTYGETAKVTRERLSTIHPDFDYMMMTLVYGPIYGFDDVLGEMETSFAMIAALIGADAPLQTSWHVAGAMRHGATKEEVDAVLRIAEYTKKRVNGEKVPGFEEDL